MSKHRTLQNCKTGTDFVHYAKHHPNTRELRQNGTSHCVAKGTEPGIGVIPNTHKELPEGTKRSVIKMLIAIGLGILVLSYFL